MRWGSEGDGTCSAIVLTMRLRRRQTATRCGPADPHAPPRTEMSRARMILTTEFEVRGRHNLHCVAMVDLPPARILLVDDVDLVAFRQGCFVG